MVLKIDNQQIIALLIARRRELKITQEELARRAGVNRRTIYAIEAGTSDVGLRRLLRVLMALDLSMSITPGIGRPTESQLAEFFKEDDE
ncbi:helix-turn-helix transcriptional regulator [Actimicrobium antarcticum]|uniref:HTH cro/C1-type domain-containing protein n=1 Tax=Actimicrobium antarcticum TaxID=1051899 RepID=A0ABP7T5A2_9BURK